MKKHKIIEKYFVKDFFDVYNPDHISAYKNLQKHGAWPVGFVSDNILFESNWHSIIREQMADAWVENFGNCCKENCKCKGNK